MDSASSRSKKGEEWVDFWERIEALEKIGALWFEPWAFESDKNDAEPFFLSISVPSINRKPVTKNIT